MEFKIESEHNTKVGRLKDGIHGSTAKAWRPLAQKVPTQGRTKSPRTRPDPY